MKKWSRTLLAGSALILLTNAVALFGVSSNRGDTPESRLTLTQRELQQSSWNIGRDNSGITLRLNWRFEQVEQKVYDYGVNSGQGGMPAWLDKAKMTELGFDVGKLAGPADYGRRKELRSKEVLLVLEMNGQAYQHQLQRVREYAENERSQLEAVPNSDEHKRRTRNAEQNLLQEQNNNSRLFVVDAGLDLPKDQRDEVEKFNNSASYEVTVAYGKRLEPWIVAASRSAAPTN